MEARLPGQEFVGRLTHLFAFRSLDGASVRVLIGRLLDRLAGEARTRGLALRWEPSLADHLLERWQPRLGVRHLTSILDHRIEEQLSVADAQGVRPCHVPDLPPQLAALCRATIPNHELAVLAVLNRDREAAFHACCLDPLTAAVVSLPDIRRMFEELWKVEEEANLLKWFDPHHKGPLPELCGE